jgi:hypothetical protein
MILCLFFSPSPFHSCERTEQNSNGVGGHQVAHNVRGLKHLNARVGIYDIRHLHKKMEQPHSVFGSKFCALGCDLKVTVGARGELGSVQTDA